MIIYSALNTTNGKRYIGQTTLSLSQRRKAHLARERSNKHFYRALQNNIGKFLWTVLEVVSTQQELNDREVYWISHYNTANREYGYNKTLGGRGFGKPTEETVRKIRKALSGRVGRKHTEETKQKIRDAMLGNSSSRGQKKSEAHKDKIRAALKGRPVSDETRAKLSAAKMGKPRSEATKRKISDTKRSQMRGKK